VDCKETQVWLHGYIDGQLDLAQTVEIERHLAGCTACSRASDNHRALQDSIHAAGLEFRCPDGLRSSISSTIRRETREPNARLSIPHRWMAIAASLLLACSISWLAMRPMSSQSLDDPIAQEVIASHVRSLLAEHLTDVASSDRHTVKPWFAGKLDFAPTVVDLSSEGFPLVGGRLDYLAHRPVGALVYHRRKHVINLFIWPSEKAVTDALQSVTDHGYQIVHWSEAGSSYWAVSDLNATELRQFMQLIRDAGREKLKIKD
jgi:anti-sigma factor RsiW